MESLETSLVSGGFWQPGEAGIWSSPGQRVTEETQQFFGEGAFPSPQLGQKRLPLGLLGRVWVGSSRPEWETSSCLTAVGPGLKRQLSPGPEPARLAGTPPSAPPVGSLEGPEQQGLTLARQVGSRQGARHLLGWRQLASALRGPDCCACGPLSWCPTVIAVHCPWLAVLGACP